MQVRIPGPDVDLDGAWMVPQQACAQVVLAHGAGAGHTHKNMLAIAEAFAAQSVASLRFNFPYMQEGKRRVDATPRAVAAIAEAVSFARAAHDLPLFVGGHSFGGRMVSHAAAERAFACEGLVFCSFPLHPPKKPDTKRAAHLGEIAEPMLFLSGERDELANPDLLRGVVASLPRARLHWLETANHSYAVLKRTRKNPLDVFAEIALTARAFIDEVL
ncbi:MAG: alpha/beta fold hydrolase [Pseudomonadota bacterium]